MKTWIILGAVLAALAVGLGAFGAHFLKAKILPADLLIFETGVKYHMYHALGLILLGILGLHYGLNMVNISAVLILTGIILFSGSLYLLVFTGLRWMGIITPLGGLCFISGWIILALKLFRT